jgi:hypothetical protein
MIRVFPRRTKWTPTDELVFFDEPPLYDLPDMPICVSVAFTWDIVRGYRLRDSWRRRYGKKVRIGGPAITRHPGRFVPGRFLKGGVTITSRGCPKHCYYCHVPMNEGPIKEISIKPGHIVQDNNLLACSRKHIEKVFEVLARQSRSVKFSGGLDVDYLEPWHIALLKEIRVSELWISCDTKESLAGIDKAVDLLSDFPINKKRCYVLLGADHSDETIIEAEQRCEMVLRKGFLPFAQLYQPPVLREYPREWRVLQRKWCRPAAYRSKKQLVIGCRER